MALYLKRKWRRFIPHFEIYLSFPLVRTQMVVLNDDQNYMRFVYFGFQWQIWKWEGNVKLFEIGQEFIGRLESTDLIDEKEILIIDRKGCFYLRKYKARFFCDEHWGKEHEGNLKASLEKSTKK